jgi:hypothetical protein
VLVWNVSGLTPVIRDSLVIADVHSTADLDVSEDSTLLMVATGALAGGVVIYDIRDRGHPQFVSRFESASTREEVQSAKFGRVNGRRYGFLSNRAAGRLVIVDLEDAARPREISSPRLGEPFVEQVIVRDGILFGAVWSQGLAIYDVGGGGRGGSLANPVLLGRTEPTTHGTRAVWWYHDPVTGSRRYAFVSEEQFRGPGSPAAGDVYAIDVSDLTNPRIVAYYHPPVGGAHDIHVDEARGYLYAALYDGGIRVLDVRGNLSDCSVSQRGLAGRCELGLMGREVAHAVVDQTPFIRSVAKSGNRLFASDMLQGLWMIDATPLVR